MNIKTLQRSAKRMGLIILEEYDTEFRETVYRVLDRGGRQIAESNDKRYLALFLDQRAGQGARL